MWKIRKKDRKKQIRDLSWSSISKVKLCFDEFYSFFHFYFRNIIKSYKNINQLWRQGGGGELTKLKLAFWFGLGMNPFPLVFGSKNCCCCINN